MSDDSSAMSRKPMTLQQLRSMHAAGDKLVMLTCYDACFARVLDAAGVDLLLVGDSLGMVLQGRDTTLAVRLDDMAYHTRCVAAARSRALVVADLPFGAYHQGVDQAVASAVALVQAGAQMVKLEGAGWVLPLVRAFVERGIPVCGHLGLTPQSVHALGGWRVQGRDDAAAARLQADARSLAEAGAALIVLELVPSRLTEQLAADLPVPLIGIGAGPAAAGQVLVLHDMLGLHPGTPPRFVHDFMADAVRAGGGIADAVRLYVQAVRSGRFPDAVRHGY